MILAILYCIYCRMASVSEWSKLTLDNDRRHLRFCSTSSGKFTLNSGAMLRIHVLYLLGPDVHVSSLCHLRSSPSTCLTCPPLVTHDLYSIMFCSSLLYCSLEGIHWNGSGDVWTLLCICLARVVLSILFDNAIDNARLYTPLIDKNIGNSPSELCIHNFKQCLYTWC